MITISRFFLVICIYLNKFSFNNKNFTKSEGCLSSVCCVDFTGQVDNSVCCENNSEMLFII